MVEKNEPLKYSVPDAHLGIILEEAPLFAVSSPPPATKPVQACVQILLLYKCLVNYVSINNSMEEKRLSI